MSSDCIGTGCKAESMLARIERLTAERDALLATLQTIKERCGKPEFVYMTARAAIDAVRKA